MTLDKFIVSYNAVLTKIFPKVKALLWTLSDKALSVHFLVNAANWYILVTAKNKSLEILKVMASELETSK